MGKLDNILLFEASPEAMEMVRSGEAVVGPGGIRRKGKSGKGFLEQIKPAVMSVADLQSLFEDNQYALRIDDRLNHLESRLALSENGMKEIENIGWMNNIAIQRTYTLTHEGFLQTIKGLEIVTQQLSGLELYIKSRDVEQLVQETQTYINYLKTDAGNLRSKLYNVTNGRTSEHLDQIAAFIKRLLLSIEKKDDNQFVSIQIISALIQPFSSVVRKYSSLYYYENDGELMPGNYNEWVKVIVDARKSKSFKEKLDYYINLFYSIPFKDKMLLSRTFGSEMDSLISSIKFDGLYIQNHSKAKYLSLDEQICQKSESGDFYIEGRYAVFLLDSEKDNI